MIKICVICIHVFDTSTQHRGWNDFNVEESILFSGFIRGHATSTVVWSCCRSVVCVWHCRHTVIRQQRLRPGWGLQETWVQPPHPPIWPFLSEEITRKLNNALPPSLPLSVNPWVKLLPLFYIYFSQYSAYIGLRGIASKMIIVFVLRDLNLPLGTALAEWSTSIAPAPSGLAVLYS